MSDIDPAGVQVNPSVDPADVRVGSTNNLYALAGALKDASPEVNDAMGQIAVQGQAKAKAQAQADAAANQGAILKDAVAQGKLEPTQNPWYIKAYNESSAAIRGQADMAGLVAQSQGWAERSDPVAFANRWAKEYGAIAQKYTDPWGTAQGFHMTADPIAHEALATNEDLAVKAIQQQHQQNVSQLMASAIESVYKGNPKADPAAYYQAIEGAHQQWLSWGGNEQDFNGLTRGAFTSAASSTGNADLLDNLKYDRGGGKGAIADMADSAGNSVGAEVAKDKYYIDRMQSASGMAAIHQQQAAQELEGYHAQAAAYAKYGADLTNGKVPFQDVANFLRTQKDPATGQPYSEQGISAFMKLEAQDLTATNTYARAQTMQYTLDPGNQQTILKLRERALTEGMTPSLRAAVEQESRNGMDETTANDIMSKASSITRQNIGDARADLRQKHAEEFQTWEMRKQAIQNFKTKVQQYVGDTATTLSAKGDNSLSDPALRKKYEERLTDAGNAWYLKHQDDDDGAEKAVDAAANAYLTTRLALRKNKAGLAPGANPRANP